MTSRRPGPRGDCDLHCRRDSELRTALGVLAPWLVTGCITCSWLSWHAFQSLSTCALFTCVCVCGTSHCCGMCVDGRSQELNSAPQACWQEPFFTSRAVSQAPLQALCMWREQSMVWLDPGSQQPFCSQSAPAEEGSPGVRLLRSLEGSVREELTPVQLATPATVSCVISRER